MKKNLVLLLFSIFSCLFGQERPMVVIIPSYKNADWYERNLNSVCFQNYTNYRVVYIDDCSPDHTGDLVEAYINKHNLSDKVTLIRNKQNKGAFYNIYTAVHACDNDDIIVLVDGDDWLKHNNVLKRVNAEYEKPHVWMTYGQFESYPKGEKGFCGTFNPLIVKEKAYREVDWITSHLRTFYAGLFKQIKLKDLIYEGELFRVTWDMAFLFPMLEMVHGKCSCIHDVLYVYNVDTPLNDYKLRYFKQLRCDKVIRSKEKYRPTNSYLPKEPKMLIDMIVMATDPTKTDALLSSLKTLQMPLRSIHLLAPQDQHQYVSLKSKYPDVIFFEKNNEQSLADYVYSLCSSAGYFLLAHDAYSIQEPLPLQEAIGTLNQTHAVSCNFTLSPQRIRNTYLKGWLTPPTLISLSNDFYAWQFAHGAFEWREPFACGMQLFRASRLKRILRGADFNTFEQMQKFLQMSNVDLNEMGICCARPYAVRCEDQKPYIAALVKAGYKQTAHGMIKQ